MISPPRSTRRAPLPPLSAVVCLLLLLTGGSAPAARAQPPAPGSPWRQYADPAAAGWSVEALEAVRRSAEEAGSAALLVVEEGRVVAAWGDVSRNFKTASLRKSLVATMVGWPVEEGRLRLDATLAELGIDDVGGLSAVERGARVVDLMAARSGVYHPAAKEPPGMIANRPARGSAAPGTQWVYNNWDFNLVGTLLERATPRGLFDLFAERIAVPLGMEEFRAAECDYELEPRNSRYAAWEFRISTRDLARFGQMILDGGRYAGRELVARSWIERMTTPVTRFEEGGGYGLMWWVDSARSAFRPEGAEGPLAVEPHFAAQGAAAHTLIVIPGRRLLIVHRSDNDRGRGMVDERIPFGLANRILAARNAQPIALAPALVPLAPIPFATARPAPARQVAIALDPALVARVVGDYDLADGRRLELEAFEGRLFGALSGQGQTELHFESATRLFSRSAPVAIELVSASPGGAIDEVAIEVAGKRLVARRAPKRG